MPPMRSWSREFKIPWTECCPQELNWDRSIQSKATSNRSATGDEKFLCVARKAT